MQGGYTQNAAKEFKSFPSKKRIHRMIPRIVPRRAQKWELKAALFGVALLSSIALMSSYSSTCGSSGADHHRRLPSRIETAAASPAPKLKKQFSAFKGIGTHTQAKMMEDNPSIVLSEEDAMKKHYEDMANYNKRGEGQFKFEGASNNSSQLKQKKIITVSRFTKEDRKLDHRQQELIENGSADMTSDEDSSDESSEEEKPVLDDEMKAMLDAMKQMQNGVPNKFSNLPRSSQSGRGSMKRGARRGSTSTLKPAASRPKGKKQPPARRTSVSGPGSIVKRGDRRGSTRRQANHNATHSTTPPTQVRQAHSRRNSFSGKKKTGARAAVSRQSPTKRSTTTQGIPVRKKEFVDTKSSNCKATPGKNKAGVRVAVSRQAPTKRPTTTQGTPVRKKEFVDMKSSNCAATPAAASRQLNHPSKRPTTPATQTHHGRGKGFSDGAGQTSPALYTGMEVTLNTKHKKNGHDIPTNTKAIIRCVRGNTVSVITDNRCVIRVKASDLTPLPIIAMHGGTYVPRCFDFVKAKNNTGKQKGNYANTLERIGRIVHVFNKKHVLLKWANQDTALHFTTEFLKKCSTPSYKEAADRKLTDMEIRKLQSASNTKEMIRALNDQLRQKE